MSLKGIFPVECPHCGEKFEAHCWTIVHGGRDEDIKELFFTGEFDLLMCPKCDTVFRHEEPFVYLEPEKELVIFVMPESYRAEKDRWIAKMQADFEQVREMFMETAGASEPRCIFGLDGLQEILASDKDRSEETEVMEFMAAEAGLKVLAVMPDKARELDIPFSLPVDGGLGVKSALKATEKLIAVNSFLPRLKKLAEVLENLPGEEIPFLKR
ncbi:MAG: CpXC domain-containing protein [Elusimicrobiales bacterium]|nr:CpXC domain-containing protein [Elusimicrobiales bacterium]